jgi:hypothetical protein
VIEIRSYRRVFDLERRIYRVDRLRLNPAGVPVRGVVYFLAIMAMALILGQLPLVRLAARALPWYLRDLALPGASAAVLTVIRIEGRPFHLAAGALVRYASGPRGLAGLRPCWPSSCAAPEGRWRPQQILLFPDGSDARMRRLRYTGPGAVLVSVSHRRVLRGVGAVPVPGRRPRLIVSQLPGGCARASGKVIVLERAARLQVR